MNTILGYQQTGTDELTTLPSCNVDWIWHGYLARGATTLLTSQWKAGKTTLVSLLLKQMAIGGMVAGSRVKSCNAAIVSEERVVSWQRRHRQLHFGNNLTFLCRTADARPTQESWEGLVDHLLRLRSQKQVELVIIDPLAPLLPGGSENLAAGIRGVLAPLERLTAARMSVLLLHHPRKGKAAPGQAARGSGALSAFVDVLVEMKLPAPGASLSRRRLLRAWSRFDATPRKRIIELSADGTQYAEVTAEATAAENGKLLPIVAQLLAGEASRTLTRDQLLARWPTELTKPHRSALWRALDEGVKTAELHQTGSGRRHDPFRYILPMIDARPNGSSDETPNMLHAESASP